jgi:hypothetical protein
MTQYFGYISALLSIIMVVPYVWDIFRDKTKPERASWLIWSVLGLIAFFSQLAKGATDSLWLTGGQTAAVVIVFLLSIKYGVGGLNRRDIKALIGAGVGLVLWFTTNEALFALLIVIIIDFIGVFLTVIKAYKEPETETLSTWLMSGTSGIFGMLAVGAWDPILLLYPLYIVIANYIVVGAILLGRKNNLVGQD